MKFQEKLPINITLQTTLKFVNVDNDFNKVDIRHKA
jgi:hypothetical protein